MATLTNWVRPSGHAPADPGTAGNARLTGMAAVVLFVLLAAEGVTILRIHRLLAWHLFIGFLLLPPLVLKLGSTGYRFARYYTGNRRYRAAGPPRPLPRLIAPLVVLSSVALFAAGVELWLFGRQLGSVWLRAHQISFLVWFAATSVHVLLYLARAPSLAALDFRPGRPLPGGGARRSLVAGAVLLGIALAVATALHGSAYTTFGRG